MDNIIELNNVVFDYSDENDNPVTVLNGISLNIERGSFTAVLGHNGSGKSTMAKLFNALEHPTSGTVTVNGMDTADQKYEFDIRKTVGIVFQNPDNQIVASIVEEDVAFGPENLGIEPKEIRKRVDEALKAVDMYEYRDHAPFKLSGGQKQRIAIAGILAMQPECIVLDEPTAMLDPKGRREVIETVKRLNKEKGMTVVLITHFMDEAAIADRVVVMDDGKFILDGTPVEVFGHVKELKAVGLDVPQPTELVQLLKDEGIDIQTDIIDVDGCVNALMKALNLEEK